MLLFSINRSQGYENPSLDIIVTERCSIGGCPLEEACEHCYLIQSVISVAISYIISVYCEDYVGYFTVILSFLAFRFCSAYFIYLVSCIYPQKYIYKYFSWHMKILTKVKACGPCCIDLQHFPNSETIGPTSVVPPLHEVA
jgi:hypothetical protein